MTTIRMTVMWKGMPRMTVMRVTMMKRIRMMRMTMMMMRANQNKLCRKGVQEQLLGKS